MQIGKYVVFELGRKWYGISEEDILEIGEISNRCKVPFNRKIIKEVINHHGRILPLVDLTEILTVPSGGNQRCFVLVKGDEYNICFAVDSIVGIEECGEFMEGETPEFIKGIIRASNRRVNVINTEDILDKIRNHFKEEL